MTLNQLRIGIQQTNEPLKLSGSVLCGLSLSGVLKYSGLKMKNRPEPLVCVNDLSRHLIAF